MKLRIKNKSDLDIVTNFRNITLFRKLAIH